MAGTVADYRVLQDGKFTLRAVAGKDTRREKFNLPGALHRGGTTHHGGIFSVGILNGHTVYDSSNSGWTGEQLTSDADRTFQEAFSGDFFSTGDNDLTIQVNHGSGIFHDLIVWFQRDT